MSVDLAGFDWDADADALAAACADLWPELVGGAYGRAGDPLGVSFDVTNPRVQDTLAALADQVRGVSATTRAEIQALVGRMADEGWSVDDLATQIRGLAEVADGETASHAQKRARTIARTESGRATNWGSLLAYGDAGVTHVDVLDGDDDEPCRSANGARWTLDEAQANPLAHPNCTRAFAPVVLED